MNQTPQERSIMSDAGRFCVVDPKTGLFDRLNVERHVRLNAKPANQTET